MSNTKGLTFIAENNLCEDEYVVITIHFLLFVFKKLQILSILTLPEIFKKGIFGNNILKISDHWFNNNKFGTPIKIDSVFNS